MARIVPAGQLGARDALDGARAAAARRLS